MEQQTNNLALASMILGIASIVLSCCCMIGVIPAGLAILFACLSRVDAQFSSQAKTGLITGIIGLLMGPVMGMILMIQMILAGNMKWF